MSDSVTPVEPEITTDTEAERDTSFDDAKPAAKVVTDDGKADFVKDIVTGDIYHGRIHPSIYEAFKEDGVDEVLAIPRSLIKDEFGGKETVWALWENPSYLPGPLPGEVRRIKIIRDKANA
jgi:hypothetical protein